MDDRDLRIALGLRLARERTARRLTQAEVAARAGCSHVTIHRVETGDYLAPMATLARVAGALGLGEHAFEVLVTDIRYQGAVRLAWATWIAANPGSAGVLISLLAGMRFDQEGTRALIRDLLANRRAMAARAAAG